MAQVIQLLVLLAPPAFLLGVAIWLGSRTYRALSPTWLIPRGEYVLARRRYEELLVGYRSRLPGVLETSRYGIAVCRGLEGDLETSVEELRALATTVNNLPLEFGINNAIGSMLVLLGRNHEEARDRLRRAIELSPAPDLYFALALVHLSLGAEDEAEACFDAGVSAPVTSNTQLSARVFVRRHRPTVEVSAAMLRGWYLLRVGRADEAKPYLERAARYPVASPTRSRAEELLAELDAAPPIDQAPPSLAAMTISRR